LSALSVSFWDFALYRFLTGLGVGGEFAVGVALVAEVMPDRARPYTLALLQALSAIGNVSAAFINMGMGSLQEAGLVDSYWRPMFVIGALPALLALVIRRNLKEPERWQQASHEGAVAKQLGSYRALFSHPVWRKHALIGLAMAFSGVVGLWAVGFYTIDLVGNVVEAQFARDALNKQAQDFRLSESFVTETRTGIEQEGIKGHLKELEEKFPAGLKKDMQKEGVDQVAVVKEHLQHAASTGEADSLQQWLIVKSVEREAGGSVSFWKSMTSIMINIGAFLGMFTFGLVTARIGRKPTFAIAFVAAAASTAAVLLFLEDFSQIFWMVPLMGICQLSLFAGYAALGPALLGLLMIYVFEGSRVEKLRHAGLAMCSVFFIGLLVLPFAPETRDKPLPE
jgi:MFS family permease